MSSTTTAHLTGDAFLSFIRSMYGDDYLDESERYLYISCSSEGLTYIRPEQDGNREKSRDDQFENVHNEDECPYKQDPQSSSN